MGVHHGYKAHCMSEVNIDSEDTRKRSLKHKPRAKKVDARVDMTPMVDLGFLLITFFMLSTVLMEDRQRPLDQRSNIDQTPISDCRVLNILIDSIGNTYTYEGQNMAAMQLADADPSLGLRRLLLNKQQRVKKECRALSNGEASEMVCLIKLLPGVKYKAMVDALDEMEITGTRIYSLQEPVQQEILTLENKTKQLLAADYK